MMDRLATRVRRWVNQDVARTNAAQASVRLQHHRRQLDDVSAYLARQRSDSVAQVRRKPPGR
jgi:hypothetical protein